MNAKIQDLEKPNKADHRDIHIQTEEFDGEPVSRIERNSILRFSDNQN